VDVYYKMTK